MRSVVYRFADLARLRAALAGADRVLAPPDGEHVADGEWVLAVFEVGPDKRATTTAARGTATDGAVALAFEARDWQRIRAFAGSAGEDDEPVTARPMDAVESELLAIPLVTPALPSEPPPASLTAPDTLRPPPPAAAPHATAQGARILVVDDDEAICDVVAAMLEAVGLVVEASPSAEDALDRLFSGAFHLVVVDWSLPGASGLELCRAIRREPATATMPVLFLSARDSTTDIVDAFASGADDFVVKPFRAPELGARIFALLRRARISASARDVP